MCFFLFGFDTGHVAESRLARNTSNISVIGVELLKVFMHGLKLHVLYEGSMKSRINTAD